MDRQRYMKTYRAAYKARAKPVKIWLANEQHAALLAAARSEGKTPTGLAREMILRDLDGDTRIPAVVADELRDLERLIRNIANNINQLAHHANTVRIVIDVPTVFAELRRLDAAIRAFVTHRLT